MKSRGVIISRLDFILGLAVLAAIAYAADRIHTELHYKWNWAAVWPYMFHRDPATGHWTASALVQGFVATIRLSMWATLLAMMLGTLMGIVRAGRRPLNRLGSTAYVELMRNIPPMVLIFIFYYFFSRQIFPVLGLEEWIRNADPSIQPVLSFFFGPVNHMTEFFSAVITLGVFEGAYIAEIVRSGIESIEPGQWDAASASGMNRRQQVRHVILPQAVRRILPPLAGQFISAIKDSAIVSVISIQELTFQGLELMAATYLTFEIWITITLLYLILTLGCSLIAQRLEVRLNNRPRAASGNHFKSF